MNGTDISYALALLELPDDLLVDEEQKAMAAACVKNWVGQYGEDVVKAKRRAFILCLANRGMSQLREVTA